MSFPLRNVVVTGASGFIGRALCEALVKSGARVQGWVRPQSFLALPAGVAPMGWDLRSAPVWQRLRGIDAVFHLAARVADWGRAEDYERENVTATRALLEACERAQVRAFVFTSTPSVVMGDADLSGVDEHFKAASGLLSEYARSKAKAEQLVLRHHGVTKTMALRPHAVIGQGDRHLVPLFARLIRLGVVPQFGDGQNLVHFTSIGTAVESQLRAAKVLLAGGAPGQAVFIADGPPLRLSDVFTQLNGVLRPNRAAVTLRLSYRLAWQLARVAEAFHRPFPAWAPVINRYRVAMLGRSHWFSLERMRTVLALEPGDAQAALRDALEGVV